MFFVVKKVQTSFQKNMEDLHERSQNQSGQKSTSGAKKPLENEGEYIDYEEIK